MTLCQGHLYISLWAKILMVICFSFQLLGDMLLDRSNSAVMMRYVSSKDHLMILMNLLRVSFLHFTIHLPFILQFTRSSSLVL
jgi:hypothetical protein